MMAHHIVISTMRTYGTAARGPENEAHAWSTSAPRRRQEANKAPREWMRLIDEHWIA